MEVRREVEATLSAGRWFGALPDDVRGEVLAAGSIRTLAAGEYLYEEDGVPVGLHGVLGGAIHIAGTSQDGNVVTMAIIRPGDWTGFLSCIDGLPPAYAAIAREVTTTFSVHPTDVKRIFERDVATFRLLLAPELAIRRKLGRFVVDDLRRPLAQRLAARLCDLGRSPYVYPVGPVTPLEHVSQEELAMSVAATRPRINEILRDLAAKGMIELGYGRIAVIDLAALERFANGH